jgi:hypothetical protein
MKYSVWPVISKLFALKFAITQGKNYNNKLNSFSVWFVEVPLTHGMLLVTSLNRRSLRWCHSSECTYCLLGGFSSTTRDTFIVKALHNITCLCAVQFETLQERTFKTSDLQFGNSHTLNLLHAHFSPWEDFFTWNDKVGEQSWILCKHEYYEVHVTLHV